MSRLREKTTATLLIAIFMISVFAVVVPVSATIINVDDSMDTPTINAAIAGASSVDTVQFAAGTYVLTESLVVAIGGVTIRGDPLDPLSVTIDGDGSFDCISLSTDGVTIDGFELKNGFNGIIGETSGSTISNNIIHDHLNIPGSKGVGILLWGDNDDNLIDENVIYDNDRQGIFIGFWNDEKLSTKNIISNNIIYNNGLYRYPNGPDASAYGIQLWNADENTIEGNEVYGHDDWFPYGGTDFDFAQGIYLCASFENFVTENHLHGNNYGVGLWSAGRTPVGTNQINLNNIEGNTGFGVINYDVVMVDATLNWWGHASGPSGSNGRVNKAGKVIGKGDAVSANVDWDPWLRRRVWTNPAGKQLPP